MPASCPGPEPRTIVPQGTVKKLYKPLAPVQGCGSCPASERQPLRHWLRSEPAWAVLAAAGLTHPRRLAHRARCLGLRPHWAGRVRVWSWSELERLASAEAQRLEAIERQRRTIWRAGR